MNNLVRSSIAIVLILAGMLAVILWFRTSPFDCNLVASKVRKSGAHQQVERWLDTNIARWDSHPHGPIPKHIFGYGSFVLPLEFDHEAFILLPDAEAQAITDSKGTVQAIQIVDSRASIVVINRIPNQWYQWKLASVSRVSDRSGVVCSSRD